MSSKINKALIAVTRDVGTLGKGALNPHGGYKYVSIDRFYESVGAAAAKHGLSWVLIEDAFAIHPGVGKTGMIQATYRVRMMHEDGEVMEDFSKLSIIHPIQGAQTVGSAMSYADKVFQRQTFKVATGEEDADSTNPSDLDFSAKPKAADKPADKAAEADRTKALKDAANIVEETVKKFVGDCEDLNGLNDFWHQNAPEINGIKSVDADQHNRIIKMFAARKAELKGK